MRHKTKICSNKIYKKAISYLSCLPSSKGEIPQILSQFDSHPWLDFASHRFYVLLLVIIVGKCVSMLQFLVSVA